jgi:acyl phosphate:glycerol-3-phosphate acyltransferase
VTELIVKAIASYVLGSLVGSLIIGWLRGGVDIRTLGSGNAGGTNALRTQGKWFALWVMIIDIGKGIVATQVIAPLDPATVGLAGSGLSDPSFQEWMAVTCAMAAILGHVYPIFFGFRGGKGVATLVGVLFGLSPMLLLVVLLVWLVAVASFGFVGLASIIGAASVPAFVVASNMEPHLPMLAFGIAVTAFVVFTHRSNLARMRAGTEPRARRLWLLGRGRAS